MPPNFLAVGHHRPAVSSGLTLKLPVHPGSVAVGRDFVARVVAGAPDDHIWAVVQCASELLTNALAATERYSAERGCGWSYLDTPLHLTVCATSRWTRVDVRDPEPRLHPAEPHAVLAEGGRGIEIVMALGHFAHTTGCHDKVVHAVIPIGDALDDRERAVALSPAAFGGGAS